VKGGRQALIGNQKRPVGIPLYKPRWQLPGKLCGQTTKGFAPFLTKGLVKTRKKTPANEREI